MTPRQANFKTHEDIHEAVFPVIERIANNITGAEMLRSDGFDEAVQMAAHDAATCLAELLTARKVFG